jgi:hypothetical protein
MPAIALYAMLEAAQRAADHDEQRRLRDRHIRDDARKPEPWSGPDVGSALRPLVLAIRAIAGLVTAGAARV